MQLQVRPFRGSIVEHDDGATPSHEKLLERENLAAVTERALREEAQLRQRIEHHPPGLAALDGLDDPTRRLVELDFRGRQHRELLVAFEFLLVGDQFDDLDAVERPAVGLGAGLQFFLGLGERDIQTLLAGAYALEQELQCQRGLARARIAVNEIEALRDQSATQHLIQPRDSGLGALVVPISPAVMS